MTEAAGPADGGVLLCRRLSDGTLWRPSHPSRRAWSGWYFRRVVPYPAGARLRYRETGEVWAFNDHHFQRPLFEVVRADAGLPPSPLSPTPQAVPRERLEIILSHERGAAEWL